MDGIAYRVMFVALVLSSLFMGSQAKDYTEKIGEYEVGFMLPDEIAPALKMNKTFASGEMPDGTPYDGYRLDLMVPGKNWTYGWILIVHFSRGWVMNLDLSAENEIVGNKNDGYNCNFVHWPIDGCDGIIISCYGREDNADYYQFINSIISRITKLLFKGSYI